MLKSVFLCGALAVLLASLGCQSMPLPTGASNVGASIYAHPSTLMEVVNKLKDAVGTGMSKEEVFKALQLTSTTKNLEQLDPKTLQEFLMKVEERVASDEIEEAIVRRLQYSGYKLPYGHIRDSWWITKKIVKFIKRQEGFNLTLYIFFKQDKLLDIRLAGPPNIDREDTSYVWSALGRLLGGAANEAAKQGSRGLVD